MTEFDAVVLAGGTGRRLGGVDKAALRLGGRTLLDGVLLAAAAAARTVVVGPERPTVRPVVWTREAPVGGGPLAGLAVGARRTSAPVVLVLATDLARIGVDDVARLVAALTPGADAAVFVDDAGRVQPLAGAYRRAPLMAALDALEPVAGRAVRELLVGMSVRGVPDGGASLDVDTVEDLDRERGR
ncbi:molybdenum cofactor guanylyltransferase [Spongisporangium articulatum]|uniref:Molybdenum cofactor guanylyltransferase n=1 Tax=Spongisporangium articulatum TaxID=3362603 RepID=A0ABW8ASD6_9ACTN